MKNGWNEAYDRPHWGMSSQKEKAIIKKSIHIIEGLSKSADQLIDL